MRIRRLLPLAVLVLALSAALPATAIAADVLPDLDQEQPDGLQVTLDQTGSIPRYHLGFDSAVDDVGAGPLIVSAHRASTSDPEMTADQLIQQTDGSTRTVPDIGRLRYVYSEDHNHWHYLGFDHYELRRAADYALVAPDQKTGFCLGDRYDTGESTTLPGEPPDPVFTDYCGRTKTELLTLGEGISVGYGDVYFANLEGQFVDLTGVAAGQYYLVHRVNADRKLRESDYTNDASSLLLDLTWPGGSGEAPSVKLLRGCKQDDSCPGPDQQPPVLKRATAERYARAALKRALGFSPSAFTVTCARSRTDYSRACRAAGRRGRSRYTASATISLERTKQGVLRYQYVVGAKRTGTRCAARRARNCTGRLPLKSGRIVIGTAPARGSAAVAQPRQRLVALDDAPLDGVLLSAVVNEVPRLVRHPFRRGSGGLPAQ